MKTKVINIMRDIIKISDEEFLDRMGDVTIWDSLQKVEIVFALEDELDLEFEADELKLIDTPEKMLKLVLEKAEEI